MPLFESKESKIANSAGFYSENLDKLRRAFRAEIGYNYSISIFNPFLSRWSAELNKLLGNIENLIIECNNTINKGHGFNSDQLKKINSLRQSLYALTQDSKIFAYLVSKKNTEKIDEKIDNFCSFLSKVIEKQMIPEDVMEKIRFLHSDYAYRIKSVHKFMIDISNVLHAKGEKILDYEISLLNFIKDYENKVIKPGNLDALIHDVKNFTRALIDMMPAATMGKIHTLQLTEELLNSFLKKLDNLMDDEKKYLNDHVNHFDDNYNNLKTLVIGTYHTICYIAELVKGKKIPQ